MIFIFSSARSGSTWLGKILDSHPDTVYLHEPDIVDRGDDLPLPFWFDEEVSAQQLSLARIYLKRLSAQRNLRTVGTRPMFPKSYRNPVLNWTRTGLIYSGKLLGRGFPASEKKINIPDFSRTAASSRLVMKSVSALGRAEALIRAGDGAVRPILLIRNPCGIIQSFLDGMRIGAIASPPGISRLLTTRSAKQLNVDSAMDASNIVDKLAWGWVLANAEAHTAVTQARGIVLHYETLTADPEGTSKQLFSELGLEWNQATAAFLISASKGDGGYYSISRDPRSAADKWKAKMDPELFVRIRDIVCRHPLGREYFQLNI